MEKNDQWAQDRSANASSESSESFEDSQASVTPSSKAFEFEENCRRLAKRYRDRLSIRYQEGDVSLCNWSATGCLVELDDPDPEERLTLLIPCEDGIIAIKTHFEIIRIEEGRAALRFVFDNAMDAAILAAHAKNAETDQPVYQEQLLKAGRPVYMEEIHRQAEADEVHLTQWGRLIPFIVTIVVIIGIGAIVIPHIRSQVAMKIGERERYIALANNRLEAAKVQHEALLQRMNNAKSIVEKTPIPLTMEQRTLFQLGIEQIQAELSLQALNLEMLESNLIEVKRGNFFYEKEAFGPFSAQFHIDSAPYLTQLLTEIAHESRLYPKTQEDAARYQQVARQRFENAAAEAETNKAKLAMLTEFQDRYEGLVAKGALPHSTLLFLKRDLQLLLIEQERLSTTVELLEANWKSTLEGNFTMETRLLDKFNPSPNPPPATFDYNFTR